MSEVSVIHSKLLTCPHGFSTKTGGVSGGIFESLNLGMNRGDADENVLENWARFGKAVGIDTTRFVHGHQSHGNTVRVAKPGDAHSPLEPAPWPEADGYVTDEPGLPLVIFTADCTPLLMQDPYAGVIAAVHCGWRSTVADIQAKALEAMISLGAKAENIRAAIGPGIRQCCFQTGPEVARAVDTLLSGDTAGLCAPDKEAPGKFRVDLPGTVERRLLQLGLRGSNIEQTGQCTMCRQELFWSHRAQGTARGSQANIIMLV